MERINMTVYQRLWPGLDCSLCPTHAGEVWLLGFMSSPPCRTGQCKKYMVHYGTMGAWCACLKWCGVWVLVSWFVCCILEFVYWRCPWPQRPRGGGAGVKCGVVGPWSSGVCECAAEASRPSPRQSPTRRQSPVPSLLSAGTCTSCPPCRSRPGNTYKAAYGS